MESFLVIAAVALVLALATVLGTAQRHGGLQADHFWNCLLFSLVAGLVVWLVVFSDAADSNHPSNDVATVPAGGGDAANDEAIPDGNWWESR